MTIPAKRRPKSKTRMGRSHQALKGTALAVCPKCKKPALPHRACAYCGYYKGREVIKIKTKLDQNKKAKKEA